MIQRVYENSCKSRYLTRVIVATDDKRIFDIVKKFGGNVTMTSAKHKSGTDRICEVIKKIKSDIVVNIQGDEPFIDYKNIDKAVSPLLKDRNINVSTLAVKIKDKKEIEDPNKVKVVFDKNGFALYFSRFALPYNRDKYKSSCYKHIGLYVYRTDFLKRYSMMKQSYLEKSEKLEQLRILENGEKIKIILTNKDSFSIDTKEDYRKLHALKKYA